ncbi:cysteine--tRNA ligase [Prochlorococcus sp. MIT 1307]|uniref:cysteine--tRNA ligase n=1 Tax=Prochlorococcus sp. MIT 1307 TaxID=3096219 RepID=UPI002A752627|nr:cysteine--tRNA ligase [Prochlorococcus sp. MIT 1307]
MPLKLTNTLSREKEPFQPITSGEVSIYCCGVTVYDLCHLGHARSYIVWDVLRRYLIWNDYKVTFVQNFTDIDDKILNRAAQEGCSMNTISERNISAFFEDMDALGILRADRMPRATKCLDGIRTLIQELEEKGAAYSVDGDVYFSVMKHSGYGNLSNRDLNEQQLNVEGRVRDSEGARKKHAFDFALWKGAKEGEPSFPSPWGDGRPGWHIECSAMVREELGSTIDIHLGGADLIFPHHENEIAQSESATGQKLARYWLHNGMVNVGGQKMSKSLGNFTTIRALLDAGVSPMTLRLFVLQAHYRKPLDFTNEALNAASAGWKGLNQALSLGTKYANVLGWDKPEILIEEIVIDAKGSTDKSLHKSKQRFIDVMDDDLNTSGALAVLFELARPLRALANRLDREDITTTPKKELKDLYPQWQLLVRLARVLGLKTEANENPLLGNDRFPDESQIKEAIEKRKHAKLNREFATADQIRNELKEKGIELIDKPGGTTDWTRL